MTDTGRLKFQWFYAIAVDDRISTMGRLILTYCATKYVFGDGESFTVKQETVARHFACRRQTVGAAFAQARELGWLASDERERGRGKTQADTHYLVIPESSTVPETSNEKGSSPKTSSVKDVFGDDEIGSPPPQKTFAAANKRGARADAVTSENNPPLVSSGLSSGFNSAGGVKSEPPAPVELSNPPQQAATGEPLENGLPPWSGRKLSYTLQRLRANYPKPMSARQLYPNIKTLNGIHSDLRSGVKRGLAEFVGNDINHGHQYLWLEPADEAAAS